MTSAKLNKRVFWALLPKTILILGTIILDLDLRRVEWL